MNVDKMRSVLAKNASIVRKEREHSAQLRQEKMVQTMEFLNQKRQETQLRREQHKTSVNRHVGSKLSQYSKAVTLSNMSKDPNRMKRVNHYPDPNPKHKEPASPALKEAPPNQFPEEDDEEIKPRRKRNEPDIWAKMYAMDADDVKRKEKADKEKLKKDGFEHAAYLEKQLKAEAKRVHDDKLREDGFADAQKRAHENWKMQEKIKAEVAAHKNAIETKLFMDTLVEKKARLEKAKMRALRDEKKEVHRIKTEAARAEQAAVADKVRQMQAVEELKVENAKLLEIKRDRRLKDIDWEKSIQKQYEEKMLKEEQKREEALLESQKHQAYLYGKGASTQEIIAAALKEAESKMIRAQKEHNKMEDEKSRAKKAKAKKANKDQVEYLKKQQVDQMLAKQKEHELEMHLAHQARIEDEKAAHEAVYKEAMSRKRNLDHKERIISQIVLDQEKKEKAKEGMSAMEMRINKGKIDKTNQFWEGKQSLLASAGRSAVSSR